MSGPAGSYLAYLTYDTVEENSEGEGSEGGSEQGGPTSSLEFVQRYGKSDNVSERQVAVRHLVKTLQTITNEAGEADGVEIVFNLIKDDFSNDTDPLIRAELLEALPMLCMHCAQSESMRPEINKTLVPLLVKFLCDQNIQVRKTCQAAILILLDQELFESEVLEKTIVPVLLHQAEPETCSDETRIETVTLLCKIVTSHLEAEKAVQLFLDKYKVLCQETRLFHIRKQCASCMGDMSTLLGPELTERVLVPHLIALGQDSVWGVRKAVAENFTDVSKNCSMATRRNRLAPSFIVLLADSSRWVQSSAFQALGQFISTFADSNRTGLKWVDGSLLYEEPSGDSGSGMAPSAPSISDPQITLLPVRHKSDSTSSDDGTFGGLLDREAVLALKLGMDEDDDDDDDDDEIVPEDPGATQDPVQSPRLQPPNQQDGNSEEPKVSSSSDKEEEQKEDSEESENEDFHSFRWWHWQPPLVVPDSADSSDATNKLASLTLGEAEKKDESLEKDENNYAHFRRFMERRFHPTASFDSSITEDSLSLAASSDTAPKPDDSSRPEEVKLESEKESSSTGETGIVSGNGDGAEVIRERKEESVIKASMEEAHEYEPLPSVPLPSLDDDSSSDEEPLIINVSMKNVINSKSRAHELKEKESPAPLEYQDIIPQALLDNFLSMVEPNRAQTVESDISRHCAYNLPAVAFTIGRQHWPLIKETYNTLANDMQWKVRRTLAFSIHELAAILGPELTVTDLMPVFSGFLRDLDEVRIGILKYLYDFVKLLHADVRKQILQDLAEFLQTDNSRNWRFRELLADQLILLCELYSVEDINKYLSPIALNLVVDKVAEIRRKSYGVVACILSHFWMTESASKLNSGTTELTDQLIEEMVRNLAGSRRYGKRQSFAWICQEILEMKAISEDKFAEKLLDPLLEQAIDPVPNVRIVFLQSLILDFFEKEETISRMKKLVKGMLDVDEDRDVLVLARRILNIEEEVEKREETVLFDDDDEERDPSPTTFHLEDSGNSSVLDDSGNGEF